MKWKNYDKLYSAVAKLELDIKRFNELGFDLASWQLDDLTEIVFSMKDQELTEENFIKLLSATKTLEEFYDERSRDFEEICIDSCIIFNTYSDNIVDAVADELGDDDEVLSYFYYDTNCSKDYSAIIEKKNGENVEFHTFEDVYRYIVKNNEERSCKKPTAQDLARMLSDGK